MLYTSHAAHIYRTDCEHIMAVLLFFPSFFGYTFGHGFHLCTVNYSIFSEMGITMLHKPRVYRYACANKLQSTNMYLWSTFTLGLPALMLLVQYISSMNCLQTTVAMYTAVNVHGTTSQLLISGQCLVGQLGLCKQYVVLLSFLQIHFRVRKGQ